MSGESTVVSVRNVSKRYFIYENQRVRLRHALWPGSTQGVSETWALRDVSFEIDKGDAVGIIGRNGSGKSTLLQIITGTLRPTSGRVSVNGRVAALLELGSGFNPQYTGRENVFLNGMLMGLSRPEVEDRFDQIAGFADIGNVLDQPVKTYSSGMLVRLAFAVQVALDPDILIVDEALSVGDYFFRQKCYGRIQLLRDRGMTLLFVTHDTNTITNICNRAVYLQKGVLKMDGGPHQAVRAYLSQTPDASGRPEVHGPSPQPIDFLRGPLPELMQWRRTGAVVPTTGGLLAVRIVNVEGDLVTAVRIKEKIRLHVYFAPDPQGQAHIYLQLKNRFNEILFTTGTYYLDLSIAELRADQVAVAEFELEMSLGGGGYSIAVMMGYPEPPNRLGTIIDQTVPIGPINIEGRYEHETVPFLGPFGLPVKADIRQASIEG